jgi:hypothetical protein
MMRRTTTRIVSQVDFAEALTREEPDLPVPGLVDLRLGGRLLDQTEVLDAERLHALRAEYEAMRGQVPTASEPGQSELTGRTTALPTPSPRPMRRVIGALLALLIGLVSWSACRVWFTGQGVANAALQSHAPQPLSAPMAVPARRALPREPAAADLPRVALEALASGDRELARRSYEELAGHELGPGPYGVAAEILARELRGAE